MFWKFRRRLRQGMWRTGWQYVCLAVFFILLTNIMVIQRNFSTMEGENNADPGGTMLKTKLENIDLRGNVFHQDKLHSSRRLRFVFENKLRKLLEIMENNLDNSMSYPSSERDVGIERYFPDQFLTCSDVDNVTERTYLASGWTKAVFKGLYKGTPVALKTVDRQGQDVSTCQEAGGTEIACFVKAAKKIVKEIVVLQAMSNENVLRVLGFCLPRNAGDSLWVAMVTELGESVDLIKLLQMSWEDRLRICLDITKIVSWMSSNPYGSMLMNDFRRQQFVLVDGTLKLSDVDDTTFEDPDCDTNTDCTITFSSANFSQESPCIHGRCIRYNEKRNIFNAGRHFVTFLLPHGAPVLLKPLIDQVVKSYANLDQSASGLLETMNKITHLYKTGWYMNRTSPAQYRTEYNKVEHVDLPGLHDYQCRFSLSVTECTISVYDQREAEDVCNIDEECRGFVMSYVKTWTGRTIVHLKNGASQTSYKERTSLFLKPG